MKLAPFAAAGILALSALSFTAPANAAGVTFSFTQSGSAVHADWRGNGWRQDRHRRGAERLSPRRISHILRRQGIDPIRFLDTRGRVYELTARARRGAPVKVSVNAYSGEIVSLRPLRGHDRSPWDRRGHHGGPRNR
ncbi:hypothetical protein [Afifella sp. IM 167]|uniref:hypothetical protein n=1 Tax=Afifella sp. IM 167 TaxID=2033586 RepID=UPI001CCAF831|nr:hypothetical protein [Afifella sp. IM 167]MBZ8132721.1 hypothetical protein [Afifella sp. IM 167]